MTIDIDPESVESQWFFGLFEKPSHRSDRYETAQPDVVPDRQILPRFHEMLQFLTEEHQPSDRCRLSDSLPSPHTFIITHSAQAATNNLLERIAENEFASAPITPFGQVSDLCGLAIYNAAFIPGWPVPAFAKNPTTTSLSDAECQRNEKEIATYLAEQGFNSDLLSKALKTFKTATERMGFLVWLTTMIIIATTTLETLRKEAAGRILTDSGGTIDDLDSSNKRRILKL